ncbi:DUF3179 domain-containing protein [Thalassobaculum sp.]|uniref:DUF3179 domain-containing protein n=1 Tax=Thalassobaculum sp. TaxID=2022740 RepID=UPI0032ED39BA
MQSVRLFLVLFLVSLAQPAGAGQRHWMADWPVTDFSRAAVPLHAIRPGGPARDDIPPIDQPRFASVDQAAVPGIEPVVSIAIGDDARAYPLRVLIWHQIVNDRVGGTPIVVTFSPLCNAALVYSRQVGAHVFDFGTTGLLRHADLVMYDRQTESWWQQYEGEAIVGSSVGMRLQALPARLESMQRFAERYPAGQVLVPSDATVRPYGRNPYTGYDSMPSPYLYDGPMPDGIAPLARVLAVGERAWSLSLVEARGRIETGDLRITWTPGQSSALDAKHIAEGRDVGNVVVRQLRDGVWGDVPYSVEFAFAFVAFNPGVSITLD